MKARLTLFAAICAALLSAAAITACGDDSSSGSDEAAETRPGYGAKPEGDTGSAPDSAGDDRPEAPDDAISDRPGGPNDKSGGKAGKKQSKAPQGSVSGGISADSSAVSPESP